MTPHRRWIAYLVAGLAAALLYLPTVGFDRTFDDVKLVPEPGTRPAGGLSRVWGGTYWESTRQGGLYRPVTSMSYWLEGEAGVPLSVRHGVNIALHVAVTLLVVRLGFSLGLGAAAAGVAGLLFALHPAHVEAVAGLVGRAELLSAAWLLLALWFHDRMTDPGAAERAGLKRRGWFLLLPAAALAFIAAGAKESAWALPVFAALLQVARRRPLAGGASLWAGYGVGLSAHLLIRRSILGGWLNSPGVRLTPVDNPLIDLHGWNRLLGGLRVVGVNLGHLVFPLRLSPDYGGGDIDPTGSVTDPRLWAGVLLIAACVAAIALGWRGAGRRRVDPGAARAITLGAGVILVSVFLTMNVGLTIGTIFADRLLYWPSLGWCLLAGGVLTAAGTGAGAPSRRIAPAGALALAAAVALAAAYGVKAAEYLPAWKNDAALFQEAVAASPRSPRAWFNLGQTRQNQGRYEEAVNAYHHAEALYPALQEAYAMEATALMRMQKWDEARTPLARALRLNPADIVSRVNEGVLWMQTGELPRAEARFEEVLRDTPDRLDAMSNLASVEGSLGKTTEAAATWRRYLEEDPDAPLALNNLAWLLATELGRPGEAIPLARRGIELTPSDANLHDTLAEALRRTGRREEAVAEAREALRLEPGEKYRRRLEEISRSDSR